MHLQLVLHILDLFWEKESMRVDFLQIVPDHNHVTDCPVRILAQRKGVNEGLEVSARVAISRSNDKPDCLVSFCFLFLN